MSPHACLFSWSSSPFALKYSWVIENNTFFPSALIFLSYLLSTIALQAIYLQNGLIPDLQWHLWFIGDTLVGEEHAFCQELLIMKVKEFSHEPRHCSIPQASLSISSTSSNWHKLTACGPSTKLIAVLLTRLAIMFQHLEDQLYAHERLCFWQLSAAFKNKPPMFCSVGFFPQWHTPCFW